MKRWSFTKTFSRIGKDLSIAVKEGGPDPETNSRLRQVIQNAKSANMPKDNILRAIKKASGSDAASYNEVSLEGYAAHGIAVFVDCTTDNNNRTVANVRSYFNKYEGSLGTNGSLEFIFDRKGVFTLELSKLSMDLEELEMDLIDGGLENFEVDKEYITILCDFKDFSNMQKCLEGLEIEALNSELVRIPNNTKTISVKQSELVLKLLDKLEDDDDVQQVFHNMRLTDEILKAIDKS